MNRNNLIGKLIKMKRSYYFHNEQRMNQNGADKNEILLICKIGLSEGKTYYCYSFSKNMYGYFNTYNGLSDDNLDIFQVLT